MVSVKFASLLGSFTLFTNVLATVFMTSPTASTTCAGGSVCSIAWEDDGKAPSLAQFGQAEVGIWVGSVTSQSELQHIQSGVNVATTSAIQFTVDPTIGPNSNVYFVRFTSATLMDPNNPSFPEEAFSAKFTLSGMKGQFNSTIQAQINGASASPIPTPAAPASSGSPSPSTAAAASTPSGSSKPSSSGSGVTTAGAAQKTNAAVSVSVKGSLLGLAGSALLFAMAL